MNMEKNILEIPIEDIIPNRFQPRLAFNEEGITELAESIKQHGIIQPLVLRKLGDKYEIIAGERRYKAATMAGLTKVPAVISDIDDNQSAEVALVENIQRRNLTAIEEAKSYKNLLDRGYLTQEQLANKMGVSQSSVANKLRLLNLDEEVQDALLNEKISERHARALLVLDNKEDQKKWLKRIIDERLTVRQLDMELKKLQENGGVIEEEIPLVEINPNLDDIVSNAEDINVERDLHDVASMLVPAGEAAPKKEEEKIEEPVKSPNKFFNFLEDEQANMNMFEPEEILKTLTMEEEQVEKDTEPLVQNKEEKPEINLETVEQPIFENPIVEEPTIMEENKEIPTSVENDTDIFNNSLDNIELLDELDSSIDIQEPTIPTIEEPTINNNIEIAPNNVISEEPIIEDKREMVSPFINPDVLNPIKSFNEINEESVINNTIIEEPVMPINEPAPKVEEVDEIKPFKSIFFNTDDEDDDSGLINEPILDNSIKEVEPIINEPLVDPLDSIVKLEPDYEQKQEELAGTDLKTAINIVRETVSDLEKRGFVVDIEEADLEDLYHITIKINKNNK